MDERREAESSGFLVGFAKTPLKLQKRPFLPSPTDRPGRPSDVWRKIFQHPREPEVRSVERRMSPASRRCGRRFRASSALGIMIRWARADDRPSISLFLSLRPVSQRDLAPATIIILRRNNDISLFLAISGSCPPPPLLLLPPSRSTALVLISRYIYAAISVWRR